ncbi:MAG: Multidrug transporter MdtB, partial [Planctomycetota bacterium]
MSEETPKGMVAWFTTHPVAANLLAFSILVGGFLTLPFVRKEVFPEISPSIVTVTVPYLGATPVEVERGVCMRIEEAVEGVTGVDKVSSVALEGAGVVTVEALQEADLEQVLDDVKARVDAITNFPKETEEPVISRLVVRKEVISVAIRGSADERTLKTLGERARDTLTTLPGITQVELYGVRPYEVSVEVSEDRLQQHGLTFDEVAAAVRRSSLDLPAGSIKAESGQTLIRAQAQAYTGTDFEQLVVLSKQDGTRVTLGEVATVVDGFADDDLLARFDGEPAVLLKVFRVGDQDALQITQSVRDWVAGDGKSMLPEGVTMSTWRDESVILRGRIELLLRNAAQGFVLVLLLLALFLQLRLALWVGFGIPVAFMGAVMLMPALDVSINLISLFSFLLVLGIVVDDAIVVGENVFEHRKR